MPETTRPDPAPSDAARAEATGPKAAAPEVASPGATSVEPDARESTSSEPARAEGADLRPDAPEPASAEVPSSEPVSPEPAAPRATSPEPSSEGAHVPAPAPAAFAPALGVPAYPGQWPQPAPPAGAQPYAQALPQPHPAGGGGRRLRVALRWTALFLVFAVFGGSAAYAVTRPERTELPGLKTPSDGRWTYPRLALPGLPPQKPRPLDTARNPAGVHYADLRTLLLPEPEQAVNDPAFPGTKGWLPAAAYAKIRSSGAEDHVLYLKENGLRHIAARAWTMPDGTRAEVYLLQFISRAYSQTAEEESDSAAPDGVMTEKRERSLPSLVPDGVKATAYSETRPYGASMTRFAYLVAGDTLAVVRLTRKDGEVPLQPFKQTVALQAQMLA